MFLISHTYPLTLCTDLLEVLHYSNYVYSIFSILFYFLCLLIWLVCLVFIDIIHKSMYNCACDKSSLSYLSSKKCMSCSFYLRNKVNGCRCCSDTLLWSSKVWNGDVFLTAPDPVKWHEETKIPTFDIQIYTVRTMLMHFHTHRTEAGKMIFLFWLSSLQRLWIKICWCAFSIQMNFPTVLDGRRPIKAVKN